MAGADIVTRGNVVVTALTHVGRVRHRNEDAVLVAPWTCQSPDSGVYQAVLSPEGGLLALADGLGGHPDGHLASAAALRALAGLGTPRPGAHLPEVAHLMTAADDAVHAEASRSGSSGMATTLVLARFFAGDVAVANVGDSRCYATDGDALRLLTTDHTEELRGFGGPSGSRTVLTRSLGRRSKDGGRGLEHQVCLPARPGQRFLLCSDGLWGVVPRDVLEGEVTSPSPLADVSRRLLSVALTLGAPDNVSLVLAEVTN